MKSKQNSAHLTDWETIALAIVLMITGFALLGGDYAGVLSLQRIQHFWPVAIIAIGVAELPFSSGTSRT